MISPPREEGWLRHQEEVGEAILSAADGVVAHKPCGVWEDRIPKHDLWFTTPLRSHEGGFATFS